MRGGNTCRRTQDAKLGHIDFVLFTVTVASNVDGIQKGQMVGTSRPWRARRVP